MGTLTVDLPMMTTPTAVVKAINPNKAPTRTTATLVDSCLCKTQKHARKSEWLAKMYHQYSL